MELFKDIGLDGIEIVVQEGTVFSLLTEEEKVEEIIDKAKELNLEIVTLTPYFWDINNIEKECAKKNIKGMKDAILLAKRMGASFVRAYGGREKAGGSYMENWLNTVSALKEIGRYAAEYGITVLVENHPGTMTRTGEDTRRIIDEVGLDNVKALYDPANVMYDTNENWEYTLNVQKDVIGYVHVKDYFIENGKRKACVVGKGIVPWNQIMKILSSSYDGYLSFEYEKRWHPEQLEDAQTGLKACFEYIRKVLK